MKEKKSKKEEEFEPYEEILYFLMIVGMFAFLGCIFIFGLFLTRLLPLSIEGSVILCKITGLSALCMIIPYVLMFAIAVIAEIFKRK